MLILVTLEEHDLGPGGAAFGRFAYVIIGGLIPTPHYPCTREDLTVLGGDQASVLCNRRRLSL